MAKTGSQIRETQNKALFMGIRMYQRDIDIIRKLTDEKYLLYAGDREYLINALTKLAQLEA